VVLRLTILQEAVGQVLGRRLRTVALGTREWPHHGSSWSLARRRRACFLALTSRVSGSWLRVCLRPWTRWQLNGAPTVRTSWSRRPGIVRAPAC